MPTQTVRLSVNGIDRDVEVEARKSLADALREDAGLTGTHLGCEHGVCGACTVLFDGKPIRSCLMFAVQAAGHAITTIEGIATDGQLHPVQQAFADFHGLQCGFCTPGMVLATVELLGRQPSPSVDEIKDALGGNLCRCTGYVKIVESVQGAAASMTEAAR